MINIQKIMRGEGRKEVYSNNLEGFPGRIS